MSGSIVERADVSIRVENSEKAIMWLKALLMGDNATAELISLATDPMECKRLGRRVTPFYQGVWDDKIETIADYVLEKKFKSSEALRTLLQSTGGRCIAEAASRDTIWGIGIGVNSAQRGKAWRGRNLLGRSLMRVRSKVAR